MNILDDILITILTPTLNCGATLNFSLRSVKDLAARFPNRVQHLIGDGGSTDNTYDLLNDYEINHSWVSVRILPRMSIPLTLDALKKDATGRWIMVLNGDDTIDVNAITDLLCTGNLTVEPVIVCGDVGVLSFEGDWLGRRTCNVSLLDRFMSVNHPSMLVDYRVFDMVGPFGSDAPTAYDYIWTWRAYCEGIAFDYRPVVLAYARLGGLSQLRLRRAAWEIFCAKCRGGRCVSSSRDYLFFLGKFFVKSVLPNSLRRRVLAAYRHNTSSIDHY